MNNLPPKSDADKHELAEFRSNLASWFYHNSEPMDDSKPRHTLD